MRFFKKLINKYVMSQCVSRIKKQERCIYLTFDDGPEPDITEFVLNELDKYKFKATFFCTGKNALDHPNLMEIIRVKGHAIGNHSFTHKHAYLLSSRAYVEDVYRADEILHTTLFRPPNGCLLLSAWLKLKKKYKIIYWAIGSGDWRKETFEYKASMKCLESTKSGDIILFHFSQDLQKGTRELLPSYLKWLHKNGFKSIAIE